MEQATHGYALSLNSVFSAFQRHVLSWVTIDNINQWFVVFLLLMVELACISVIILPISSTYQKRFLDALWKLYRNQRFRIVLRTIIGIVTFFFLDSLRRMYLAHAVEIAPKGEQIPQHLLIDMELNLVKAERNALLCGFAVYLFIALHRFHKLLDTVGDLKQTSPLKEKLTRIPVTTITAEEEETISFTTVEKKKVQ